MQQLQGFSRLQTVPSEPATAARRKLWILSSWRDLVLYVGTPLLLIPAFALAQAKWSPQDIYLFVAAFGAMGHHLPGMIRAYGDRALFDRFRWRFILAPVFLLVTCTAFYWWDLKGIILVVFFWGVWHGMMQTYGFCRIYDAKTGSFAALNRRLDFWLCAIWFAAAVVLSPLRMTDTLGAFYASGGPFIAPSILQAVQRGLLFLAVAVSILFVANFIWMSTQAKRPNPVKLALLITSISFWWYSNNLVSNLLVGIALFEVFHDVQYLSLVWIYNRNRVEKDQNIGGFMRFVFRRSGSLVGLYLGLIFAYGSLAYFNSHLQIETIKRILTGVVTASALLHFYYDGFIWKVRESSTRAMLGISGGGAAAVNVVRAWPAWTRHALRWAVLIIPFGALCAAQLGGRLVPALERTEKVAEVLPRDPQAQLDYGKALHAAGRVNEAIPKYEAALQRKATVAEAEFYLGLAWKDLGDSDQALDHYQRSVQLDPKNGKSEANLAGVLAEKGRMAEARTHYERSLALNPELQIAHKELADLLCGAQEYQAAIDHYEAALRIQPDYREAKQNLDFAKSLTR